MATDVQTGSDTSVTKLVTGILHDAEELFKQQVALFKHEVREDLRKTRDAVAPLAVGAVVAALGGFMLLFALGYLIHEAGGLPRWAAFGIVALSFLILGGGLLYAGKKKFDSFNPLPDESADALKENVQWIVNPK
jgi:hypothetical protein